MQKRQSFRPSKLSEQILIKLGYLDGRSKNTKKNLSRLINVIIIERFNDKEMALEFLKLMLRSTEKERDLKQDEMLEIVNKIKGLKKRKLPHTPTKKKRL